MTQTETLGENILVMVRVRPLGSNEAAEGRCIKVEKNGVTLDSGGENKQFAFDYVADEQERQETVFAVAGKSLSDACLEGKFGCCYQLGYNATVFAYGQTGAGKTFTIQGPTAEQVPDDETRYEQRGLMPRIFDYLFSSIARRAGPATEFMVKCAYMEIYMEQIVDLLDPQAENLRVREDIQHGAYVEGLIEEVVDSAAGISDVVSRGLLARHTGSTAMNKESSRSHSVLILTIESKSQREGVVNLKSARFHVIDLAGSERQKSTDAAGERLKEAGNINRSLSVLGSVINSLVEVSQGKSRYIHYRDSKLTFLLKDSLGGNSKTVLIANVSPAASSAAETLSTLNFARRAKQVKNKATINEDTTGTVLLLQQEVKRLKSEIARAQASMKSGTMPTGGETPASGERTRQVESLLQTMVELRASDAALHGETAKGRDRKISILERAVRRYLKEKDRDMRVVKMKDSVIEKMQANLGGSVQDQIAVLRKEIAMLKETENGTDRILAHELEEPKTVPQWAQKIAEQEDYFQQMAKYLKEVAEEKAMLAVRVGNLQEKLQTTEASTAGGEKLESLITKVKLDYGEKIDEMSRRYLE